MDIFRGRITSTGFSTGHRIVIGDWSESILGNFTNIMWAKPDGTRVLLSPSATHAEYVSRIYTFEEVRIVDFEVKRGKREIFVSADALSIRIRWGISLILPLWRPLWFIASFEAFFGKLIFGTITHGKTRDGRREWYSVRSISRVLDAEGSLNGVSIGSKAKFHNTTCFGFSEPPSMPASVSLKSYIE